MRCTGAVAACCALLAVASVAIPPAVNGTDGVIERSDSRPVTVTAVSFDESSESGAALAALLRAALGARGVVAQLAAPPGECGAEGGARRGCLAAVLAALARGALTAALVPGARAPPPPQLRDAGLEELADAAPPARRACYASPPTLDPAATAAATPRSLLDFADAHVAARYSIAHEVLQDVMRSLGLEGPPRYYCKDGAANSSATATIVTGADGEAELIARVASERGLRACAAAVGAGAAASVLAALAPRTVIACGRTLDPTELAASAAIALGPPPCLTTDCPFETRRLLKLVNVRELAHAPTAIRTLGRIYLNETDMRELARRARVSNAEEAARAVLAAHPEWAVAAREVRVAVMIPVSSHRETFDAVALRAAAELAERDEWEVAGRPFRFKVESLDDACSGSRAFKYLTDALGTEFGALSAVAGPACGAAFGDVLRQSGSLALPVLAYTAQAPPAGTASLALLAAGDARRYTAAWAALLALMSWRRVAVLSELATRPTLDLARLGADVVAHVELPDDSDRLDGDLIVEWASRVTAARGRIMYVSVEDARAVRAALCAGRAVGLRPESGAVWLLPALPPGWLAPTAADAHNCSHEQLAAVAEGHLSVTWRWATRWEAGGADAWRERWARRCERARGVACEAAPAHAALLYDVLRLWAAALARLASTGAAALDDLHQEDLIRSLVKNATDTPYEGVTGAFEWEAVAGGGAARGAALVLRQWRAGHAVEVDEWRSGALVLAPATLRWLTPAGAAPDDGAEHCALQPLADVLRADCRAAFAAVCALAVAAMVALLAAAAWHCRRRAERDYRARLAALGMRALGSKPTGLDRWELPRERVVINRKLGTGAFGTVYGGHALLVEDRGWSAVAVKTLKAGASTDEKLDFLAEAEAMKRFSHKNVVRLLGVVTQSEPVCTVMEFMLYGDLKSYLVARRALAGAGAEVSAARLTALARDAARGLSYLATQRYVHRDVAARNCLLSAQRVLKLADFGMARLVHEHDYYRFSRKGLLPVRWMAPESLTLGLFSPASDVWAFGVLLYEIVTFGALPFQGLCNAEVLARVKAGHTLDLPLGIKPQLETLIRSCWAREAGVRPAAAALAVQLAETPRLLVPCVDAPLDALPLALEPAADRVEGRWLSWAAPASAATDSTYLSADAPRDTDAFLPEPPDAVPARYHLTPR